jgi:hypothetical protein
MKRILFFLFIFNTSVLMAQPPVEVQIFQKTATATTAQIGVRVRAVTGTVDYIGVTFYIMYQSANATPQSTVMNSTTGVDDSKLVSTFGWGTSTRFTNPAQVITPDFDPVPAGGPTYDRRYIYGNSDELTPTNTKTLTTAWDTLLYITFNTLQSTNPEGGMAYQQKTSEAMGTALTDPAFANIDIDVTSGEIPIGLGALPVLFTKFEAGCTNNGAVISWTTTSESNSKSFELQRSTNGNNWASVATIKAAGNSAAERNYQQLDLNGGNAFYRIKQIDLDGHFMYTSIIRTNCDRKNVGVVIYPVPARDLLNVVIKSDKTLKTQLIIIDGLGKIVRRMDASLSNGSNTILFNLKGLASGEYMIRSNDPSVAVDKKFNIVR